jgi:hypothetical protein
MKERPILFSGAMVRALLDDSKTQTRRLNDLEYFSENEPENWRCVRVRDGVAYFVYKNSPMEREAKCPYGQPGDRLYVRETFRFDKMFDAFSPAKVAYQCLEAGYRKPWAPIQYEADGTRANWEIGEPGKTRVSIHMPRWASRILLEITGVRVERLNDCSVSDAMAEGVFTWWRETEQCASDHPTPPAIYRALWESINGAGSWALNPWVWVVEFKRVML